MGHAHHITHWADGGPTALGNLVLLCGHHHRLIHSGPWRIETTTPGDFDFHPPDGTIRPTGDRAPPDD